MKRACKKKIGLVVLLYALLIVAPFAISQDNSLELAPIPNSEKFISDEVLNADHLQGNPLLFSYVTWPSKSDIAKNSLKNKESYAEEIERTWFWFDRMFNSLYLPSEQKEELILMPEMKNNDDCIIVRYNLIDPVVDNYKIQVIDGRTMTIIAKPAVVDSEISLEEHVIVVFKKLFNYNYGVDLAESERPAVANVQYESDSLAFGDINYPRGEGFRWLKNNTVVWWSDGNTVLFDIEKLRAFPSYDKGPVKGSQYVGGISHADPRDFIRFDPNNKIDFDSEFTPPDPGTPDPDAENGPPLLVD